MTAREADSASAAGRAAAIRAGDRRALAQAVTLVESTRAEDRAAAEALLAALCDDGGSAGNALRLAVSGAPGVGKSTFIEAFGLRLIEEGKRPAVLAVDPSSARGGGSVLGDKTRMAELSRSAEAFVRPSPGGVAPGGVARRTGEAIVLCEAAGFDVVVVETVGAGQSEFAARDLVDMFLLLVAPGGGDELQGIKRGIVEMADLVVVNKNDGALAEAAMRTLADYGGALALLRPATVGWTPRALACSALERRGLGEIARALDAFAAATRETAGARRSRQAVASMWTELRERLEARLRADAAAGPRVADVEGDVAAGRLAPAAGARRLLELFLAAR